MRTSAFRASTPLQLPRRSSPQYPMFSEHVPTSTLHKPKVKVNINPETKAQATQVDKWHFYKKNVHVSITVRASCYKESAGKKIKEKDGDDVLTFMLRAMGWTIPEGSSEGRRVIFILGAGAIASIVQVIHSGVAAMVGVLGNVISGCAAVTMYLQRFNMEEFTLWLLKLFGSFTCL